MQDHPDSDDENDNGNRGRLLDNNWKQLLTIEGKLYRLRPWGEIKSLNPNKVNLSKAFREVMRKAWGGVSHLQPLFPY
jgi:hypothetical protein